MQAELIGAWLDGRAGLLNFPAALEHRYEQDTEAARRRGFRITTLICLTIYLAYLPFYMMLLPQEAGRFAVAQLCVALPFTLSCLALAGARRSAAVREGAFTLVGLVCLAAITWAYQGSHAATAANMRYWPIPALLYVNVVLGVRFPYAAAATGLMIVGSIVDCEHAAMLPALRLQAWTLVAFVGAFSLLGTWRLERQARRTYLLTLREAMRSQTLGDANRQLLVLSMLDPLTGLANRRGLDMALTSEWDMARRGGTPVTLLMIDVDCFKRYNDRLGHMAGDDCLRQVASALHAELRLGQDTLARYGGEEFVAITRSLDLSVSMALAERMRRAVEALGILHPDAASVTDAPGVVTVSVGCAFAPDAGAIGPAALLSQADRALYLAKRSGRNQVSLAEGREDSSALASCRPAGHQIA